MRVWLVVIVVAANCCSAGCGHDPESPTEASASIASGEGASRPTSTKAVDGTAGNELRKHVIEELDRRGSYRRPSAAEMERTVQLFAATLSPEAELSVVQSQWEADGFDLFLVDDGGESFWILKEQSGEKFGRGVVAIRCAKFEPVMLQAPHSFYDRDTDEIALGVFIRSRARACYWNTVHRRVADLTKEADSFLNALSTGFAQAHPFGRVAQFHGFSQTEDGGRFGRKVDLIISQGTESPDQSFLQIAMAVRRASEPYTAAVFPLDIQSLGGTLNEQRNALLGCTFRDFVHCEMSPAFRSALRDDFELQIRVGRALTHLELNPEIE